MDPVNDLRVLRNLLDVVARKWHKIGIQLGIPKNKLDEFQNLDDRLSEVISYWLHGNVEGGDPVSWETIIKALRTKHVDELGLATIIQDYCKASVDPVDENRDEGIPEDHADGDVIDDLQLKLKWKKRELKTEKEKLNKIIDKQNRALEKEILKGDELKRKYLEQIKFLEEERKQHIGEIADCRNVIEKKENEVQDLRKKVEEQDDKVKRAELEKKILHLEKNNKVLEMQKKYDGEIAQLRSDMKLQTKQSKLEKSMTENEHLREKNRLEKEKHQLEKEKNQLEKEKNEEENKHLQLKIKLLEENL